jgi:hypothetical protein
MEDRVAEHEVERLVVEWEVFGVGGDRLDRDAELTRLRLEGLQHPG